MEAYMALSQESRLGGAVVERLAALWEQWLPLLQVYEARGEKISWLAVWLPESVENQVDGCWSASPAEGWLVNTLAQFMCMSAVQELLPEVEEARCAPSPRPTRALRETLARLQLSYKENSAALSRRYAVVTHYPYRGGCGICQLQNTCPKGQSKDETLSVLLPGYEKNSAPADK
ncbi:MAG: hypothetical protein LBB66_09805 [Desulfovibrio sp.]|jgi:hypothetical protein|nr:hypothetical protein [Desulfovibrio sp.]